jgi:glutaminyl-tRNA synthetase
MADAVTESVAKLQLDPETGEMVSKNELKKRMQKRAKKAAAAAAPKKATPENRKPKAHVDDAPLDPELMFKQGFLEEVFKERPVTPTVTRFPPEPNGL